MDQGTNTSGSSDVSPMEALRRMREEQMSDEEKKAQQQNVSSQNQQQANTQNVQEAQKAQEPEQKRPEEKKEEPKEARTQSESDGGSFDLISKVQYGLFILSLLLIPSFIIPLPWGWSEFGKGMLLMVFAVLLATLELMKVLLNGKFSVVKGFLDISVLLVFTSFLLSTIFSGDRGISTWAFDHRYGTGLLVFLAVVIFFYILRSFMTTRKRLGWVLFFAILGIGLSALLSLVSFAGANLLGFISSAEYLFVPGLPLLASAVVGIVFWGAGLLLSAIYLLYADKKSIVQVVVVFTFGLINILAIGMFSLNQGMYAALLVVLAMLAVVIVMFLNTKLFTSGRLALVSILAVLMALSFVVLRVPSINDGISDRADAITQIALPGDVTWTIVTSTLSDSVRTGVVGLGVDTFSVYYNVYKPASINEGIDITETNFTYGNNEALTMLGNRGMVGALIWLAIGVMILYQLFKDFSDRKGREPMHMIFMQLMDILLLFVFAASMVSFYGFEIYFIFVFLFGLRILFDAVLDPKKAESFVIKMDILFERVGQKKNNYLLIGLAVLAAIAGLFLLSTTFTRFAAGVKAMGIENNIIRVQNDIAEADQDREPGEETNYSVEKREEELTNMINEYGEVTKMDPNNSVYHRRRTILMNEYISLLADNINTRVNELVEAGEEDQESIQQNQEVAGMQDELNAVIEIAIEEAEMATEKGPNVYANWDTRGLLYANLIGLGLTNYTDSGLFAVNQAIQLNPTSYNQYYRAAEMFVVAGDLEQAGAALTQALNINPNHIPSLLLGSEIAIANQNFETAQVLLGRIIEILEAIGGEESDLYEQVSGRLAEVEAALEQGTGGDLEGELDPEDLPEEEDLVPPDDEELPDDPLDPGLGDEDLELPEEEPEIPADEEAPPAEDELPLDGEGN